MGNIRACSSCRKSRTPGVGKQVKYLYRTARIFNEARKPVPVYRLLGKQARVLKGKRLKVEGQIAV